MKLLIELSETAQFVFSVVVLLLEYNFCLSLHISIIYYIDTSVLLENIPLVKFIKKLHPGPVWFIFHHLTREFIDDSIDIKFVS